MLVLGKIRRIESLPRLVTRVIVSVSQLADSSGLQTTLIESLGNNKPSKVEEPEENSLIRY
jgi:hypothetical protein